MRLPVASRWQRSLGSPGSAGRRFYELRARYGDSPRDLRLAVLQSLAVRGPQGAGELVGNIGHSKRDEVRELLDAFASQSVIDVEVDPEEQAVTYYLTEKGDALLDHWRFEEIDDAEARES